MTRMLCVCGSQQSRSANRAALDIVANVATARGMAVDTFDDIGTLPPFDAGRVDDDIDTVSRWRRAIDAVDLVMVGAPEYAGGLAGIVKNAFDWLVGSATLYRKPVALLSAGTSGGWFARQHLAQTLTWQGAYVVGHLGISHPATKTDDAGRIVEPATVSALTELTTIAIDAAAMSGPDLVALAGGVVRSLGIDESRVAPAA
ncbi:MAG TPA: NADPH-dependent FMN reductase [Acidimicrobiales bacterium]|nr:NADPH-dependent FMN reductase [Acidimicrobiales bacterium]